MQENEINKLLQLHQNRLNILIGEIEADIKTKTGYYPIILIDTLIHTPTCFAATTTSNIAHIELEK